MGVWSFFIIKETKGKTLEELDILFGGINADRRAQDVEAVLHSKKDIVHHEGDESVGSKAGTIRVEDSPEKTT